QPQIAHWNLARLAEALLPLIPDQAPLEKGLNLYAETFNTAWRGALAQKLGVSALDQPGDDELLSELFTQLYEKETDFTLFFRNLAAVPLDATDDAALLAPLQDAFYAEPAGGLAAWLRKYAVRARHEPRRVERMNKANPKYIFRNYLAQLAIDALEKGDTSVMERLLQVLERPYDEQPAHQELAARRPEWARNRAGCSALSCSS
ncbi:MAG TPA: protein adenylyltransferase SelO family protein, partial [Burkholderiales bacterium]